MELNFKGKIAKYDICESYEQCMRLTKKTFLLENAQNALPKRRLKHTINTFTLKSSPPPKKKKKKT